MVYAYTGIQGIRRRDLFCLGCLFGDGQGSGLSLDDDDVQIYGGEWNEIKMEGW